MSSICVCNEAIPNKISPNYDRPRSGKKYNLKIFDFIYTTIGFSQHLSKHVPKCNFVDFV